jgi:hypothetical protein
MSAHSASGTKPNLTAPPSASANARATPRAGFARKPWRWDKPSNADCSCAASAALRYAHERSSREDSEGAGRVAARVKSGRRDASGMPPPRKRRAAAIFCCAHPGRLLCQ